MKRKIKHSLIKKMVILFTSLMMIVMLSIGTIFYFNSVKHIHTNTGAQIAISLKDINHFIDKEIVKYTTITDLLSKTASIEKYLQEGDLSLEEKNELIKQLNAIKNTDKNIEMTWAVSKTHNSFVMSDTDDIYESDWQNENKEQYVAYMGKSEINYLITMQDDNKPALTIAKNIKDKKDQNIGLVLVSIHLDDLQTIFDTYPIDKQGYLMIVDNKNDRIIYKKHNIQATKEEVLNKFLKKDEVLQLKSKKVSSVKKEDLKTSVGEKYEIFSDIPDTIKDSLEYQLNTFEFNGNKMGYSTLKNNECNWTVAIAMPYDQIWKELKQFTILFLLCMVGLAIMFSILIPCIMKYNLRNIPKILDVLEKMSEGKFNTPITFSSQNEIGAIANGLNIMQNKQRELLGNIQNTVANSLTLFNNITHKSTEIQQASKEISMTMEELAKGATSQASETYDTAEIMSILKDVVDRANRNLSTVLQETQYLQQENDKELDILNNMKDSFQLAKQISQTTQTDITALLDQSQKVDKIIGVISSIADQTNLLALNASIEAARAGDAGKGFAVVAEEVRKLAEQSTRSTVEIAHIISNIKNQIEITSTSITRTSNIIEEVDECIDQSHVTFDTLNKTHLEFIHTIGNLGKEIQTIDKHKNTAVEAIQNISSITEEFSSAVEETSALASNENESILQVVQMIEKLTEDMDKLTKVVAYFEIKM